MKSFLLKFAALAILVIAISCGISYVTFFCGDLTVWPCSYQRGFIYQYRALQAASREEPKMVFLGGSHIIFSLDIELMARETGYPVYALGVNSCMGMLYVFDLAPTVLNSGDIVIIPVLFSPLHAAYGMPLIYHTLDNEHDLLRDFILDHPQEVASSLAYGVEKRLYGIIEKQWAKNDAIPSAMDARNFNPQSGAYHFNRECEVKGVPNTRPLYNADESDLAYLEAINKFTDECHERGITVLVMPCQCWKELVLEEDILPYDSALRTHLHAPVIGLMKDYLFDRKYIYDNEFHLTNEGVTLWTKRAASDIKTAMQNLGVHKQ